jgi:hypothetical protein
MAFTFTVTSSFERVDASAVHVLARRHSSASARPIVEKRHMSPRDT